MEVKSMIGDFRDAAQFIFSLRGVLLRFRQVPGASYQKKQVGNGGKRVIDFMGKTGGQLSGDGQFFGFAASVM
jgi:hypothetical protein